MRKKIVVQLTKPGEPGYYSISQFIKKGFSEAYKANLEVSETLFSLVNSGDLLAACGITHASETPLFLEHYTKQPIEQICETPRNRIVEISHLMGASKGVSQHLFPELTFYCLENNIDVVAFTGTRSLLRGFGRYKIPINRVCKANEESIEHLGGCWGSYYHHDPHVTFVRVKDALDVFQKLSHLQ